MIIANPIYDSVFKYLLEDIDIAEQAALIEELKRKLSDKNT